VGEIVIDNGAAILIENEQEIAIPEISISRGVLTNVVFDLKHGGYVLTSVQNFQYLSLNRAF